MIYGLINTLTSNDTRVSFSRKLAHAYFSYVVSFSISLLNGLLIPVIPLLAFSLGASQVELGLIGSAGPIAYIPMTLMAGKFSDRFGRKPLLIASPLVYSIACLLYFFSSSPMSLILIKILDGIAMGILWPPIEALMADSTISEPANVVSNFSVSWSLGSAFGSLISSWVINVRKYRDIFIPASAISLIFSIAAMLVISEGKNEQMQKQSNDDPSLSGLSSVWIAAFLYAFCQGTVFALYPAYAELRGIPGILIGLTITTMMAGRTSIFLLFRKMKGGFKLFGMVGAALIGLSIIPLIFVSESISVLVLSFLFGLGTGLTYAISIRTALSGESTSRGKRAGLFEGSIGIGYFIGPFIGGLAAQARLEGPYLICAITCALAFLKISMNTKNE